MQINKNKQTKKKNEEDLILCSFISVELRESQRRLGEAETF